MAAIAPSRFILQSMTSKELSWNQIHPNISKKHPPTKKEKGDAKWHFQHLL
jgi:hypothetical protein